MERAMQSRTAMYHSTQYSRHAAVQMGSAQPKFNPYQAMSPASPIYSRPGSSCSQPPTLFSNGPTAATSIASLPPKPVIMLDTDYVESSYFPATPPLSISGSAVGSPQGFDALPILMNPMCSGVDGFTSTKSGIDSVESSFLDWTSCGSPPMTPVFVQSQSRVPSLSSTTSDLCNIPCPSLSPSPAPYARSVTSDSDVDFCDPRNLTVSATSNPTLTPQLTVAPLSEEQLHLSEQGFGDTLIAPQAVFGFTSACANDLPALEDFAEAESDEDYNHNLIGSCDISRPRACTGSSVVTLGHASFIADEDFHLDQDQHFESPALLSPPCSVDNTLDAHKMKRQKRDHDSGNAKLMEPMVQSANDAQATAADDTVDRASPVPSESSSSTGSDSPAVPVAQPTNRRGRKQSLTEDPSKTFVCDLCNRRFRRQEHLKRHYRSLHTQEKPFECHDCGKKFSRSDNLAQHARTHATGGGVVMNLMDNIDVHGYDGAMLMPHTEEDISTYGKVLFQIAAGVPGSSSELSSGENSDDGNKKRKRSD